METLLCPQCVVVGGASCHRIGSSPSPKIWGRNAFLWPIWSFGLGPGRLDEPEAGLTWANMCITPERVHTCCQVRPSPWEKNTQRKHSLTLLLLCSLHRYSLFLICNIDCHETAGSARIDVCRLDSITWCWWQNCLVRDDARSIDGQVVCDTGIAAAEEQLARCIRVAHGVK